MYLDPDLQASVEKQFVKTKINYLNVGSALDKLLSFIN